MHEMIRVKTVFIFSLILLLNPLALAQSGPDDDNFLPYEESVSGDAKAEDKQQAEAAPAEKPKPKAEKSDESKKPEADQAAPKDSKTITDSADIENNDKNQPDTSNSAPSTPAAASTTPTFSGPMALDSSIGCLAGSCLPDVFIAGGLGVCASGPGCAGGSTIGFLLVIGTALVVGGGSVYLGSICLGPMSSVGAIVGGVVAALSDDRAWWLPVVGGAPGLLLGLAGSGCLAVVPIALGVFSNNGQIPDQRANSSNLLTVLVLSGMAAAISAGPLSLSGIILADSIWGASQQGEEQAALAPTKTRMSRPGSMAWPKMQSVKFKQAKQPRSTSNPQSLDTHHPATGFVAAY